MTFISAWLSFLDVLFFCRERCVFVLRNRFISGFFIISFDFLCLSRISISITIVVFFVFGESRRFIILIDTLIDLFLDIIHYLFRVGSARRLKSIFWSIFRFISFDHIEQIIDFFVERFNIIYLHLQTFHSRVLSSIILVIFLCIVMSELCLKWKIIHVAFFVTIIIVIFIEATVILVLFFWFVAWYVMSFLIV